MKTANITISFDTKDQFDIRDITEEVKAFIKKSEIKNGLVNIQSFHTTATIFLQENEPMLLNDIKKHLEKMAPQDIEYGHNGPGNICFDGCKNGHSHCKATGLPSSITINLINGEIQLGQWQQILFIELDRARPRKVQIQVIGE